MVKESPEITRYSKSFKLKVVEEIESGKLNKLQASQMYGIKGGGTINSWIKAMGKNHLISKIVRVEGLEERNILKEQARQIRDLQAALADAVLENKTLKATIEVASEDFGIDIKKKFGTK